MKIEIDKGNKYQLLGAAYKKNLKRISRAITPKEYRDLSEEAGFPTIKYDGEFSIVHWEEGQDPAVYSAGVGLLDVNRFRPLFLQSSMVLRIGKVTSLYRFLNLSNLLTIEKEQMRS